MGLFYREDHYLDPEFQEKYTTAAVNWAMKNELKENSENTDS